jgi:hypothetical protein
MWIVWRRADKQNGVGVDKAANSRNIDLVVGKWALDEVNLDVEVLASLEKRRVSSVGNDPILSAAKSVG